MEKELQENVARRLTKIAGQVAGVQKMVESDRYCVDVLTQIAAIRSALHAVGVEVLAGHVRHCVSGTEHQHEKAAPHDPEKLIAELRDSLNRFAK